MYAVKLSTVYIISIIGVLLWTGLNTALRKGGRFNLLWIGVNFVCLIAAIYIILSYTVLNRTPSDNHIYTLFAPYSDEFYREMVMNAFLYFPFGLTASVFIDPASILVAFVMSVTIESWQYITGSGVAQGTDVLMNTLGTAIGCIPVLVVKSGVVEKTISLLKKMITKRG